jgi:hypothetical protein
MAMRETVRSLQAYFILSGLASLSFSTSALRASLQGPFMIAAVIDVISIGLGLAFLYIGFSLAGLLKGFCRSHCGALPCKHRVDCIRFLARSSEGSLTRWVGHSHLGLAHPLVFVDECATTSSGSSGRALWSSSLQHRLTVSETGVLKTIWGCFCDGRM